MIYWKMVIVCSLIFCLLVCAASADPMLDGKPVYLVKQAPSHPDLTGDWAGAAWRKANTLRIKHFLPEIDGGVQDSGHRPDVRARVLYDAKGLYVHFRVKDRYVRSITTEYRGPVWEDAAVEFFVQPKQDRGYFNFEINCGGAMLLSYHEHPDWKGETLRPDGGVPWELASMVKIYHSMPDTVDPEIAGPVTWHVEYFIPFALLEAYLGPLGSVSGQTWRANFYKIAENNSHPHFGAWSKIEEGYSFHQPEFFGYLRLGDEGANGPEGASRQ